MMRVRILFMVVFTVCVLLSAVTFARGVGASVEGTYVAKGNNVFRNFTLGGTPGKSIKPIGKRRYHLYTAVRVDGTKDRGVWSLSVSKDGGGYLVFESHAKDFSKKKREQLVAVYAVADIAGSCTMRTRPVGARRWNRKPEQLYRKDRCSGGTQEVDAKSLLVIGSYVTGKKGNMLASFSLRSKAGSAAKSIRGRHYYAYTALRADGMRDSGVWSLAVSKDGGGYIILESHKSNFANGKREQSFAIYNVAGTTPSCVMRTRPVGGRAWHRQPEQRYKRVNCTAR